MEQFLRSEILIGKQKMEKLQQAKVAIFGIGGVGSFVAEGLIRAGIGKFILVDSDTISITNLNRQIHANWNTIGKPKVEVMKQRMLEINPKAKIEIYPEFYLPTQKNNFLDNSIDYIVDAVDTITAKIGLVEFAKENNIPIISSMGTGNKINPQLLEVTDISKTKVCPLARVMRRELKKRGINSLKVVSSIEEPIQTTFMEENKKVPGSMSFVPSIAGLLIASEVVKDIFT